MEQNNPALDWDANKGTEAPTESHSWGVGKQSLPRKETLMQTLTEPPADDMLVEVAMELGSQDLVQLHMGDDNLE